MAAIELGGSKRWEANLRLPLIGQKLRGLIPMASTTETEERESLLHGRLSHVRLFRKATQLTLFEGQAPRNVAQVAPAAARV